MAYTDTSNIVLHMPVPGTQEPAAISLLNENCVQLDLHDHLLGKGVGVGRLRAGISASQPAAGQVGGVYFASDSRLLYIDDGTTWLRFFTDAGDGTEDCTLIDPIIRDALAFGPEGSGVIDAVLGRTSARHLDTDSTITINPSTNQLGLSILPGTPRPSAGGVATIQLGPQGFMQAGSNFNSLVYNAWFDGAGWHTIAIGPAYRWMVSSGGATLDQVGAAGTPADSVGTWVTRLSVGTNGTLTLTPDAAASALVANGSITTTIGAGVEGLRCTFVEGPGGTLVIKYSAVGAGATSIQSLNGSLLLAAAGGVVAPIADNTYVLGTVPGLLKWVSVAAVAGTIQTSSAAAKEGITPLDPAACYQAAKDVRWYEFAYLPPAYHDPEPDAASAYDATDSNEVKAEKKALRDATEAKAKEDHARLVAETASTRRQRGFVFPAGASAKDEAGGALPPVPDLFGLPDRESTTPQADLATLGAALQEVIRRLESLEATDAPTP